MTTPTQVKHPWRATARTAFQVIAGFAPLAPEIYHEITQRDPAAASGAVGGALALSLAVTRVMQMPAVDALLTRLGVGAKPKQSLP